MVTHKSEEGNKEVYSFFGSVLELSPGPHAC